ncbi:MAG: rhomboid family intramembrane serine protease [Oscillospiraceae bacterium]|jgi:hypothetical protein|nr:rhomboid family intramembrane serine protease [Oscillospiraceae bacterium]
MKGINRFFQKHERFGVKNLMLVVAAGQGLMGLIYLGLLMFNAETAALFIYSLYFVPAEFLQGEVWRLVTFLLVPNWVAGLMGNFLDFIFAVITLVFYVWVGRSLERFWGRLKLTVYYAAGALLTAVYALLLGAVPDPMFINLSLFFALATMIPDETIRAFMIFPIKFKYLALAEAAYFIIWPLLNPTLGWGRLVPLVAILNFLLFCGGDLWQLVRRTRVGPSRRTIQFKSEIRRTKAQRGYIHKCDVCGRTDTDCPDMEFRYCSLCVGYACYCADHIFNHTHKTNS